MKNLLVGVCGHAVAIDKATGTTVWQTQLQGGRSEAIVGGFGESFVSLATDGNLVFAHTRGKVYCLTAETGEVLWRNDLPKLGFSTATLCALPMTPDAGITAEQIQAKRSAGS